MEKIKVSAFPCMLGSCTDRFCSGYREQLSVEERLELAAKVRGLQGVELLYPTELTNENAQFIRDKIRRLNLEFVGIMVDLFSDPKWMNGSFTNPKDERRAEAIQLTKEAIDIAKDLRVSFVELWLGQDGFDYLFQRDYAAAWNWLIEGLRECVEYDPKMQINIEYKPKEPRRHSFVATVGKVLLITNEIGLKNVGAVLDIGHALYAYENPAESIILLNRWNRLSNIHLNDNYRYWDDDLIVGAVHFWELLEIMFWLREIGYKGWYTLDVSPIREDPVKTWELSIANLNGIASLLEKIDTNTLKKKIREGDVTQTLPLLKEVIFPKET